MLNLWLLISNCFLTVIKYIFKIRLSPDKIYTEIRHVWEILVWGLKDSLDIGQHWIVGYKQNRSNGSTDYSEIIPRYSTQGYYG